MKLFILLFFIPSLIAADILCPHSKTTCPEDEQCCEVDGEYSCCKPDGDHNIPDKRMKTYPGVEMMTPTKFGNVSFSDNESTLQLAWCGMCFGTCCDDGCCSHTMANCCGDHKCCPSLHSCCKDSSGCCPFKTKCCPKGGCCKVGYNCCESWCCKEGFRCGSRGHTCISKGARISVEIAALLLLAASVFVSRRL